MRRVFMLVVALAVAGSVEAQVVWFGAGALTSWEYKPAAAPEKTWQGSSSLNPTLFVGVPLSDDTLLRVRSFDLPYRVLLAEEPGDARLRGITATVDYLFTGVLGSTAFSAGVGSYQLALSRAAPAPGEEEIEGWRFGWFVGVGEWFTVTRRGRVMVDITMHRTEHWGTPTIVAASVSFAVAY